MLPCPDPFFFQSKDVLRMHTLLHFLLILLLKSGSILPGGQGFTTPPRPSKSAFGGLHHLSPATLGTQLPAQSCPGHPESSQSLARPYTNT